MQLSPLFFQTFLAQLTKTNTVIVKKIALNNNIRPEIIFSKQEIFF